MKAENLNIHQQINDNNKIIDKINQIINGLNKTSDLLKTFINEVYNKKSYSDEELLQVVKSKDFEKFINDIVDTIEITIDFISLYQKIIQNYQSTEDLVLEQLKLLEKSFQSLISILQ